MAPPFGDAGLKTDDARAIVELLNSTPVGSEIGVVVIGPMDDANFKSADVLLKTLEESDCTITQPILWAHDLGAVTLTIRSRCLQRWAPALGLAEDDALEDGAREMVAASLGQFYWQLPGILARFKGKEKELLAASAEILTSDLHDAQHLALWSGIRQAAKWTNTTPMEVLAAFLPKEKTK